MSWQRNYMPLGFATAQNDGTIERTGEAPSSSAFPLSDSPQMYDGSFAQSPPAAYDIPRRPVPDRSSSSATLLGEYASSRPESLYTKYSYRKDSEPQSANQYPVEFKPIKQFLHLLGTGFLRFLISAGLIIALWQIIWRYSAFPVLNQSQKRMFNFLVTAFSLALGLNLASSLKSVAVKGRWWVLSWEKRSLDEVEAILGSHSLTTVCKLACTSVFKRPSLTIGCSLWLLINLATQVFVAALSLNWTIEPAIDSSSNVPGSVMYSNMSQFYFGNDWDSTIADEITAHMYGELSMVAYNWTKLTPDAPNRLPPVEPLTLYQNGEKDFFDFDTYTQYVFLDVPGESDTTVGSFYSNRSVTTESKCTVQTEKLTIAKDGTTISMANETGLQPNSTTYYATPSDDGTARGCGNRCARVYALENDGVHGYFYSCNVTVSPVANTTRWQQQIPDNIARIAGESIALTGYGDGRIPDNVQSTHYDHNFVFGTFFGGNATSMEFLLRIYAMGAIVSADRFNPYVPDPVPGLLPNQGVKLTLDHPTFIEAILGGIGGFHLVLFIVAAWLANKVIVIDDSYLAIALLMRPIANRLQDHGSLLDSKGICMALKHPAVTYGTVDRHTLTGKIKHLEISEMANKPAGSWKGWYD